VLCFRKQRLNNDVAVSAQTLSNAAPHPSAEPPAATFVPPGARLARLIVVLCFVITTLATALIYWRWVNVSEPTSYIVIQGEESYNGTYITVSARDRTADPSADVVATATLSPENHYVATIFLQPGTYNLTATQNGETLINDDLWVVHRRWKAIILRPRKPPANAAAGDSPAPPGVS
jgi:hypothetical protein